MLIEQEAGGAGLEPTIWGSKPHVLPATPPSYEAEEERFELPHLFRWTVFKTDAIPLRHSSVWFSPVLGQRKVSKSYKLSTVTLSATITLMMLSNMTALA